jgi:hypothetical protein
MENIEDKEKFKSTHNITKMCCDYYNGMLYDFLKIGYARKTYDWCELLSNKLCNMHGID